MLTTSVIRATLTAAAIFTAAAIESAAQAHALSDQQHKFVADVADHGGPSMDQLITPAVMETDKTLGDAVCADIKKGTVGANEVIGVAKRFLRDSRIDVTGEGHRLLGDHRLVPRPDEPARPPTS